jgi:hypothetical protein
MWGNDTTDERNQAIKRTKKVHEKSFVRGKSNEIDESTIRFKHKVILKIYNPKES